MQVDQTLHGYRDGHRLLAASITLPRIAQHLMLAVSDISGRSITAGFQEYVTAYPIADANLYAFAKTWYASEMERPGCVWTHTLLFPRESIRSVGDLGRLIAHFRRPDLPLTSNQIDAYSTPIDCEVHRLAGASISTHSQELIKGTIEGLYTSPHCSIVIPETDSNDLVDLLIEIWNQQWPGLRYRFAFCSGSISFRKYGDTPFDLQVTPNSSLRQIQREKDTVIVTSQGLHSKPRDTVDPFMSLWLEAAVDDLIAPDSKSTRAYLWHNASWDDDRDAFATLIAFKSMVRTFSDDARGLTGIAEVLGQLFPESHQGRRIKYNLLGRPDKADELACDAPNEYDKLFALSMCLNPVPFDVRVFNIEERTGDLWRIAPNTAKRLLSELLSQNHNAIGELVLATFVAEIPPQEVFSSLDGKLGALGTIVRRHPEIATIPGVWLGPPDVQREVFDAVTNGVDISDNFRAEVVTAILESGSNAVVEPAVRRFGTLVINPILKWLNQSNEESGGRRDQSCEVNEVWRRLLMPHRDVLLIEMQQIAPPLEQAVVEFVAGIANPHSDVARRSDTLWLQAVNDLPKQGTSSGLRLCAFSLALALDAISPIAMALAKVTFDVVHGAIASGKLEAELWSHFENSVPRLSPWRNWDKCERLRRSLITCFQEHEWSLAEFMGCAVSDDTFNALLQTCNGFSDGRRLLWRLRSSRSEIIPLLSSDRARIFSYWV